MLVVGCVGRVVVRISGGNCSTSLLSPCDGGGKSAEIRLPGVFRNAPALEQPIKLDCCRLSRGKNS